MQTSEAEQKPSVVPKATWVQNVNSITQVEFKNQYDILWIDNMSSRKWTD